MDRVTSCNESLRGRPRGIWIGIILVLSVLAIASFASLTAGAETITWTNTSGGSWGTASNWNPQDVPNEAGEEAVIPEEQGTYAISLNASYSLDRVYLNNEAATLQLATRSLTLTQPEGLVNYGTILGGGSFHGYLNQAASGRLGVPAGTDVDLYGSAANAGRIDIGANPVTGQSRLYIATVDYAIDGPGEIVLHGESDPNLARLEGYYGTLIQGAEHTIRGAGTLAVDLNSAGRVIADQNGYTLLLNGTAKANSGLLEATNGGILELASITLTQGGGGQLVSDGGRVRVNASTVNGGTLNTMNGGVMETAGSAGLTDVTSLGELRVPGGSWTYLRGSGTTNEGTIWINPDGSGTDGGVYVAAYDHQLQGSGEVVLRTAGDPNDARITHNYGTLTQGAGHTIRGAGRVLVGLTNEGLVQADVPGQVLLLDDQLKTNNATFQAIDGGILRLGRAITQGPAGRIVADGSAVELQCNVTGGTIESTGGGMVYWGNNSVVSDVHNLSQLNVPGGETPRLSGTGTVNDGTILINSDSVVTNATVYIQNSTDHQLQGSGEIVLQSAGDVNDAQLWHSYGSLIQGAEHTIRGAGRVGVQLTNEGLVQADVPGQVLLLDDQLKTNNATFQAIDGGILRLGRETTQGAGGRILADGGTVEVQCNVTGGTIESTPGSVVYWQGATVLSNVHNLSEMLVPGANTPRLSGTGTTNDGTILVNSDSIATDVILYIQNSTDHQLQGSGEIVLQSAGSPDDARIAPNYGSLVQGAEHTIRGAGHVTVGLTNQGLVKADVIGQVLQLDGEAKTNAGTLRAENGATLTVNVALANTGLADARSGGTFRAGVAPANYQSGTLTGGSWEVHDNSTMRLLATNIQRINARVLLDGPNANLYRDDGTTPGLGSLVAIEDLGDFELAGGRSFATAGNLALNAGKLTVGAGSTLTVNGQYTQSGNGETGLDAACVNGVLAAATGPVAITGGRLSGNGVVQNDVQSSGWVCPGASVGELTIGGSLTQGEPGTCQIELAGPNAGQYDHLQVTGAAQLAGRLIVQAIDGYLPPVGAQFTIMNFASRTGTFTLETGSPGSGLEYTTQYYADRVVITITSAPSSVPDGDEVVDGSQEPPAPGDPEEPAEPEAPALVLPTAVAFAAHPQAGGAAAIELALPWDAVVEVSLFDLNGRRIALLRQGPESAGTHSYRWDGGRRYPSGVYLARVRVSGAGGTLERCVRTLLIR